MKIVIAGIGKFGDYLTRQLVKQNNEVTGVKMWIKTCTNSSMSLHVM